MVNSNPYPDIRCYNPQTVFNPVLNDYLKVPCGNCPACKLRKNSRLAKQIRLESLDSHKVVFATLTYANTYIPRMYVNCLNMVNTCVDVNTSEILGDYVDLEANTQQVKRDCYLFDSVPYLKKSDYQAFLDRLRDYLRRYCKDNGYQYEKIRYFICGEYGPKHYRPHFHLLLFLKSDLYTKSSEHTLSEFPDWTWSKREDNPPQGTDILSVCEYYIRKSWTYGAVDCDYTKGECSSYVAGYVNGFGNLPRVFQQKFCSPFVSHSAFLGYQFCKEKREEVYALTPECFVKEGVTNSSIPSDNAPIRSCYSVFYPKCSGYAVKNTSQRLVTYRCYLLAKAAFPELAAGDRSLLSVSTELAMYVREYRQIQDLKESSDSCVEFLTLLHWLFYDIDVRGISKQLVTDILDFDKLVQRIYVRLLLSRHFLMFVCNGDCSMRASKLYLSKIDDFYNYLERAKLVHFYEEQEAYFTRDYSVPDDVVFFYDSVDVTPYELREMPEYKAFTLPHSLIRDTVAYQHFHREISDKVRKKLQTKLHNDSVGIFINP